MRLKSGSNMSRARADDQSDAKLQNKLFSPNIAYITLVDVTTRAALPYNKIEMLIGSQTNYEIKIDNATLLKYSTLNL